MRRSQGDNECAHARRRGSGPSIEFELRGTSLSSSLRRRATAPVAVVAALALASSARADVTPVFTLQSQGTWGAAQTLLGARHLSAAGRRGRLVGVRADRRPHLLDRQRPRPERPADGRRRDPPHVPRARLHADDLQGRDRRQRRAERPAAHPDPPQGRRDRPGAAGWPPIRTPQGGHRRAAERDHRPAADRDRRAGRGLRPAGRRRRLHAGRGARRGPVRRRRRHRCSAPIRTGSTPSRSPSTRATAASGSATSTARRSCTSPPTARVLNRIIPAGVTVPPIRRSGEVPGPTTVVATQGLLPRAFAYRTPEPRHGGRHADQGRQDAVRHAAVLDRAARRARATAARCGSCASTSPTRCTPS